MKEKRQSLRISSIRQAAGTRPGLPGNYLVNVPAGKEAKAENWFNSRELRNALIGGGLSPMIPCLLLVGATLTFTRLEIEATDLPADGSGFKYTANGREITYKQVGVHNVALELDITTLPDERIVTIADLSMKHQNARRVQPQSNGAATDTTVDDPEVITELTDPGSDINQVNQPAVNQPAQLDVVTEPAGQAGN